MRAGDTRACAALVRGNPVLADRYGPFLECLEAVWADLLDCRQPTPAVFEEDTQAGRVLWGVGVSAFVREDFLRELKTPPHFWVGREIARLWAEGRSPLLSDREIGEAGAGAGLHLVVCEACSQPAYAARQEAYDTMISAFIRFHRGYRLQEMIAHQSDSKVGFLQLLNSGGNLWRPARGCWSGLQPEEDAGALASAPHVVGIPRPTEAHEIGSWVNTLFQYTPPCLGLSRAQQRLLLAAENHLSDEELTGELNVSLSAVKKTWQGFYLQIGRVMPELLAEPSMGAHRGREKRHRVLAYVASHSEELR